MLETERLIIRPLTYDQLIKYLKDDQSLEEELELMPTSRTLSAELLEALEEVILPNVADERKDYLYSTLWTLISKEEKRIVGDLCFVGEPNPAGEIEIGYGTYDSFQRKGYMTEAVHAMIQWALEQPNVRSIYAATDSRNIASYKVLLRNQFRRIREADGIWHWKLELK